MSRQSVKFRGFRADKELMRKRAADTGDRAGIPEKGSGRGADRAAPGDPRSRKVESIRETYRNGNYRVEPKKVADRMVDDAVKEIRARRRRGSGER